MPTVLDVSVQSADSGMVYPWNMSNLLGWFFFFFFFFFRKAGDVCLACFFGNFLRGRVYNMNPLWSCGTGWKSPEREKRFGVLKT